MKNALLRLILLIALPCLAQIPVVDETGANHRMHKQGNLYQLQPDASLSTRASMTLKKATGQVQNIFDILDTDAAPMCEVDSTGDWDFHGHALTNADISGVETDTLATVLGRGRTTTLVPKFHAGVEIGYDNYPASCLSIPAPLTFISSDDSGAACYRTTFSAGSQTQNIAYTLPPDDGDAGEFMQTNGSGALSWQTAVTAEVDPKVGTLTNTKWCVTDGSVVNCATDAPVTAEADPIATHRDVDEMITGTWMYQTSPEPSASYYSVVPPGLWRLTHSGHTHDIAWPTATGTLALISDIQAEVDPRLPIPVDPTDDGKVLTAARGDAEWSALPAEVAPRLPTPANPGDDGKVLTASAGAWAATALPADGDAVTGNEVTNATNATLTRLGAGTSGDPYTLGLNLANANTWTAAQNFSKIGLGSQVAGPHANTLFMIGEGLGQDDLTLGGANTTGYGIWTAPRIVAASALTEMYGTRLGVDADDDGSARTITALATLALLAPTKSAGITATTAYSLYVNAPTSGVANYGIYNRGKFHSEDDATFNGNITGDASTVISLGTNPAAATGLIRMPNGASIAVRNALNTNDFILIQGTAANKVAIDPTGFGATCGSSLSIGSQFYAGTGVHAYGTAYGAANSVNFGYNQNTATPALWFAEGSVADGFEAEMVQTNPTADRFQVMPDESGVVQLNGTAALTVDDVTPDVRGARIWTSVANGGATAITDLDNPTVGQIYILIVGSATNPISIADAGNFALSAAWAPDSVGDNIVLYVAADNSYYEISRSNN